MLDILDQYDRKLFLFLNQFHNSFFDRVMNQITDRFFWIPLYVLLVVFLVVLFRKKSWLVIIMLVCAVVSSDVMTSRLCKPLFKRLRPCHEPEIAAMVHVVKGCGGMYGFASSHAANTFALAFFLFLLLFKRFKWIALFLCWATIVSCSRIYVGVHYPGDIIGGALIGALLAYFFFTLYNFLYKKIYINF